MTLSMRLLRSSRSSESRNGRLPETCRRVSPRVNVGVSMRNGAFANLQNLFLEISCFHCCLTFEVGKEGAELFA